MLNKITFIAFVLIVLFSAACAGPEKSEQTENTEKVVEKTAEKIPVKKTVADYYKEMLIAVGKDLKYEIIEKDFDNNFMKIKSNDQLTEVYIWKNDDSTILFGIHEFKLNYAPLPSIFQFDGKTLKPLKFENIVVNSGEMLKYINLSYPNLMRKKGHKNCCTVYGYLPKTKEGIIELVAENADAANDLRDRSASKERVGTLEFSKGKFTFVKQ